MDKEVHYLIYQLMFGFPMQQDRAYDELRRKGIPANRLDEWKERGAFKKDALKAAPPDDTRVIKAETIPEPYFVWRERKSREMHLPPSQSSRYTARPDRTRVARGYGNQSAGSMAQMGQYTSKNLIPLTSIGLSLTGIGSEYTLKVNNFDLLKEASKNGKFVANWNGRKVWSIKFYGNPSVPKGVVAAEKAAFQSTFKTLKLVKNVGRFSNYAGGILSIYEGFQKNTQAGWAKAGLDVIMTGVAFAGPFGAAVSGIYFVYTGALSLHDDDWWEVFWKNYLTDPNHFAREALDAFDKADRAYRRITGRGLLQGPKL